MQATGSEQLRVLCRHPYGSGDEAGLSVTHSLRGTLFISRKQSILSAFNQENQKMNVQQDTAVDATIIALTQDLVQDWGLELEGGISSSSRLVGDLAFASVDIIQLCVAIEQHYETKLGFQKLLMADGSYKSDLSLQEMADFVGHRLATLKGSAQ